jgi:hypothetical protein
MSATNFRNLKTLAAGTTLALFVAAALFFQYGESVANHLSAPKAPTHQNANLGDDLPGSLGSGFEPILW